MTPEQKDELTTGFRLLIAIALAPKEEEMRGEPSDLKEMALFEFLGEEFRFLCAEEKRNQAGEEESREDEIEFRRAQQERGCTDPEISQDILAYGFGMLTETRILPAKEVKAFKNHLEACARCRKDDQQVFDLLSASWRLYERWLVCKN